MIKRVLILTCMSVECCVVYEDIFFIQMQVCLSVSAVVFRLS